MLNLLSTLARPTIQFIIASKLVELAGEPMNNAMLFYIIFQTNLQKTWKVMERVTPV